MKSETLFNDITSRIESGGFGNSGERFPAVRAIRDEYNISIDTSMKLFRKLSEQRDF